ncbi:MAG: SH3 domain-containing protein, partial [Oscillospiraceae bacterium]|nr:SH3 domain-containing protein [Oscillospiraceae bacterium]
MLQTGIKRGRLLGIAALALTLCLVAFTALASSATEYYMANSVYMYSASDTSSGQITQLAVGQAVRMLGYGNGSDGNTWHYIEVISTGQKGYILSGNISAENPVPTQGNTAASGQLVVTSSAAAPLKTLPLASSAAVATASNGTVLTMIGTTKGMNGETWYYVSYAGQRLYIEGANVQSYVPPTSGTSSGVPAAPGNGSTATAGYRYAVTATRYVNMRSAPSTSASVVAQVPAAEIVVEQMSVIGSDGKTWRYVSWGSRVGYMRSDYLTVLGGGSSYTPVPAAPTPTPPPKAGYSDFVITYAATTLKKDPSSTTTLLTMPAGVALRPVSTYTDDDNVVWYQVIYSTAGNDQVGYVQRSWVLDNPTWEQLINAGAVTPSPSPTREGAYTADGYLITVKAGVIVYGSASLKDKGNGN